MVVQFGERNVFSISCLYFFSVDLFFHSDPRSAFVWASFPIGAGRHPANYGFFFPSFFPTLLFLFAS